MNLKLSVVFVLGALLVSVASGANILFYQGTAVTFSHQRPMIPILEALIAQGHNVTLFSPYQYQGRSEVNEFFTENARTSHKQLLADLNDYGIGIKVLNIKPAQAVLLYSQYVSQISLMDEPAMVDWIRRNKFDLVITESCGREVLFGMAHYWNAKVITYVAFLPFLAWDRSTYEIPDENSWLREFDSSVTKEFGFFDRLRNFVWSSAAMFLYENLYIPGIERMVRGKLEPDMPPMLDVIRERTELVFVNWNVWDQFARPLPPFVQSVAGTALNASRGARPLPKDIREFLSEGGSSDFIYVSMGTMTMTTALTEETAKTFLQAFGATTQIKFLFKWDGEKPVDTPKNVLLKNWYPQMDVLGDKKIRGFITQGGQNSMQEAIFHAVPLIILPISGDQDVAGSFAAYNGFGRLMAYNNLTVESLQSNIQELLTDDKYERNIKKFQEICKNEIAKNPTRNAVEWINRILQGEDLTHLKPLSINQPFWVYRSLDVLFVVFLFTTAGALVFMYFSYLMFTKLRRMSEKKILDSGNSETLKLHLE